MLRELRDIFVRLWETHFSYPVLWTPKKILKEPESLKGKDVCLYVALCANGELRSHAIEEMKRWHKNGFDVILVAVVDRISENLKISGVEFCSGVLVRRNSGVDFGAWACALRVFPEVRSAELLALINDSVITVEKTLSETISKVKAVEADLIGIIESWEFRRHYQSWALFYRRGALSSASFNRFWGNVKNVSRQQAIIKYELELLEFFQGAGLRCSALITPAHFCYLQMPASILRYPRLLVEFGCSFVKTKVFTQNPHKLSREELEFCAHVSGQIEFGDMVKRKYQRPVSSR